MRCNNCGLDYIADNAANCPRCNAPLQMGYQQPPQQYQQPPQQQGYQEQPPQQYGDQQPQYQQPAPQGGYYAPPQGGYYQQPPMPPKRVPTVKNINLTEILMVVSGMFLLAAAVSNLSWVYVPSIILGIVSLLAGLVALGTVLIPDLAKQMKGEIMDMLLLVFGLVLVIWGLIVNFVGYGVYGPEVFIGGLGLLAAGALRMGILK